jgi:1,4-alpha-glucan branching enzyme
MTAKKVIGKNEATGKSLARKTQFDFSASESKAVYLAGDFNNWESQATPLKRNKRGIWKTSINLKPGRYEYRFIADGNWENDSSCCGCVPNGLASMNCVKIVD